MPIPAFALRNAVGPGRRNDPEDLNKLLEALLAWRGGAAFGFGDRADEPPVAAVRAFQRAHNLKPDGVVAPGGATEAALDRALAGQPPEARPVRGTGAGHAPAAARPNRKSEPTGGPDRALLAAAGFDYAPDPMGRLGRGHWVDRDGRRLTEGEVARAVPAIFRSHDAARVPNAIPVNAQDLMRYGRLLRPWGDILEGGGGGAAGAAASLDGLSGAGILAALGAALRNAVFGETPADKTAAPGGSGNGRRPNGSHGGFFEPMMPQPPEPPKDFDPEKTKKLDKGSPGFPALPPDMPPTPGFRPENREQLVEIFPADHGLLPPITIVESRGSPETQNLNADIAQAVRECAEELGLPPDQFKHIAGARDADGNDVQERVLKVNRDEASTKGGVRPDVWFGFGKDGPQLFINTIDSRGEGDTLRPSGREARAGGRIIRNGGSGNLLLMVPKPRKGEAIDMATLKPWICLALESLLDPHSGADEGDTNVPAQERWHLFRPGVQ